MVVVYTLQAFSSELPHWGNEAAVVLNADSLSIGQMQRLATEIWFSETAFISHSRCADFKVRFFTPNNEVDLCGHATIASFSDESIGSDRSLFTSHLYRGDESRRYEHKCVRVWYDSDDTKSSEVLWGGNW